MLQNTSVITNHRKNNVNKIQKAIIFKTDQESDRNFFKKPYNNGMERGG